MHVRQGIRRAVLAAALALAGPAAAWSNQGHMVTGAIAHDRLAVLAPGVIAAVEQLMPAHPDWPKFAAALAPYAGAARQRRLFELMARWPDDARGGPYDRSASHYWVRVLVSRADPVAVGPAVRRQVNGQAVEAFALHLATLRDVYAPPADRAMSLCWLIHLAGDIQQPLHTAQLVSGRFPQSDAGGAFGHVRLDPAPPSTLHEYWDNIIGGDNDDDANVEAQRQRLAALWPLRALPEHDGRADARAFRRWADESHLLAWRVAYDHGRFEAGVSAAAAVAISPAYRTASLYWGQRRLALSGYRIADALRLALPAVQVVPAGPAGPTGPIPRAAPSATSGSN